ncbi:transposase [Streptomyces sp. NPDC052013]|uniref:transposase n=1 Tax=Streptomyces sp. NPDC052013 TaxID=3365679 RepID=UPI0037D51BCA
MAVHFFCGRQSRPHLFQLGLELLHPHCCDLLPLLQNRPHRRHPPPPRHLVRHRAEAPATAAVSCLTSEDVTQDSERERPLRPSHLAEWAVGCGDERLVSDELWELPAGRAGGAFAASRWRQRRHGDREVQAAIVFLATSGCTWQQLATSSFGPSGATAHRQFTEWTKARVWAKLHRLVLDALGSRGELEVM